MFFSKIKILIISGIMSIVIIALLLYINTPFSNLIATVFGSIATSIMVSSIYNEELHNAMDKYIKIGLVNYFDNFEDAHGIIKDKITKAKSVDILVMYGDSFLNTSTKAIQSLLARDNTHFRYFLYSTNNKFIESYGYHWGVLDKTDKYNEAGLKLKINNVIKDLKRLYEMKHKNCVFEIYEIQSAPLSYSFYKIDNELFFVSGKNVRAKEMKPAAFHFINTKSENTMFNKITYELELMIKNNEVIKIEL